MGIFTEVNAQELMNRDYRNLLATAEDGQFRGEIYRFGSPSVTCGRNSRVTDDDVARWRSLGHDFARRPTGGGILRHEGDISFGFAFASRGFAGDALGSVSRAAQKALGAQAIVTGRSGESGAPARCFEKAIGCELTLDGEKLLGLAARKIRNAILVQGSITVSRNFARDQDVIGAGPRVDLSRYDFDEERFREEFYAGLENAVMSSLARCC